MILKMVQQYAGNDAVTMVVECDRYIVKRQLYGRDLEGDIVWFYDEDPEDRCPTIMIQTFRAGHAPAKYLLTKVDVYVMNDKGKTIDTIYA